MSATAHATKPLAVTVAHKTNAKIFAMKNILLLLILLLTFANCRKINNCDEKEKFVLAKRNYNGNELRTDGYYYSIHGSYPFILYRNGVAIGGRFGMNTVSLAELENLIISGEFYNSIKDDVYCWELFEISNNTIKTEYRNSLSGISCRYLSNNFGTILNDTTFVVNSVYNRENDQKTQTLNDTFRFKIFTPKPDSTNQYIE